MKTEQNNALKRLKYTACGAALLGAALLLWEPAVSFGQDNSYTMAPPVSTDGSTTTPPPPDTIAPPTDPSTDSSTNAAASTVFNWQEVPVNQKAPINRAVFDQQGYQLFDTVGETIVIPFKNDNLYVLKFAVSPDGSTYFVNSGTSPILYLPQDGYLQNATVDGARWYPFTKGFAPSTPVFLGVAPSWNDYVSIGWYPDMYCYGGYYSDIAFGYVTPSFGLFISFGGHHFDGWRAYGSFCSNYPPPFHIGYYNRFAYTYARRAYWGGRTFQGGGGRGFAGGPGGSHSFGGNSRQRAGGHVFQGAAGFSNRSFSYGAGHGYGGGTYRGNVNASGFGGAFHQGAFNGGARSVGGSAGGFGGRQRGGSGAGFSGGSRTFGGSPGGFGGGQRSGGGFGGGQRGGGGGDGGSLGGGSHGGGGGGGDHHH